MSKWPYPSFYTPPLDDAEFSKEFEVHVYQSGWDRPGVILYRKVPDRSSMPDRTVFMSDRLRQILEQRSVARRLCFGVPTRNSEQRIYSTLAGFERQLTAARNVLSSWDIELVIASNGCDDKTEAVVTKFQNDFRNSPINIVLLSIPISGKVDAINILHTYAQQRKCSVLALADDDVVFSDAAILLNIQALLDSKETIVVSCVHKALAPQRFWERVFVAGGSRKKHQAILCGRTMFMDVESYSRIPSHVLSDDFYLTAHFLDPDSPNPLHRIRINPATIVYFRTEQRLTRLMRRYERVLLGWKQILEMSAPGPRNLLDRALQESTWIGSVGRAGLGQRSVSSFLHEALFDVLIQTIRAKVGIELLWRRFLGKPKILNIW